MHAGVNREGRIHIVVPDWPGSCMEGLLPAATVNGQLLALNEARGSSGEEESPRCEYRFEGGLLLRLQLDQVAGGTVLTGHVLNTAKVPVTLNRLDLLSVEEGTSLYSGEQAKSVVMLVQSAYSADIVGCHPVSSAAPAAGAGEPNIVGPKKSLDAQWSENVWLAYDRRVRQALLVGFRTSERFQGGIGFLPSAAGGLDAWHAGFDGGDLRLDPGVAVPIEELLITAGPDPWALLEAYGDHIHALHQPRILDRPPVSWCSWYPYRLGVSAERLMETARIAARRLKPLGLTIIEADLGWEKDHLPAVFEPNERFPGGLAALSRELAGLGLELGAWKGPFSISEFDPMVREHPDWLICGEDGLPVDFGTWFWVPHGKTHLLDLTHPEALAWLRDRMSALQAAGVRYFKADFIASAGAVAAKRRHNPGIVLGGGTQARRQAAAVMRGALDADALFMNCGGPEMPGTGHWPLIYAANDTGNTGFINWTFQRGNFRAIACHLWKNRRWGIIQPSCLCVGLPGGLEEARLRATMAFLSGGQIDISDTLTTLGEDRWAVLEATLPPLGVSARPIDLFDPVMDPEGSDYVAVCSGNASTPEPRPHPAGSVWQLDVQSDWDRWTLVAFFSMESPGDQPAPVRFAVPLERLGLDPGKAYWATEFWSGQFLGALPGGRRNPNGYRHPGDIQDLLVEGAPDHLNLGFTGPGVKLLCLRRQRLHPWVVATGFHQSCGTEVSDVRWDPESRTLRGMLHRPAGLRGYLLLSGGAASPIEAKVGDRLVQPVASANGAWRLDITAEADQTPWLVRYP